MAKAETRFKVGDNVRLVRDDDGVAVANGLRIGGEYPVSATDGNLITLTGAMYRLGAWRFELATPPQPESGQAGGWVPKVGDKVRLRSNCTEAAIPADFSGKCGRVRSDGYSLKLECGLIWNFGGFEHILEPAPAADQPVEAKEDSGQSVSADAVNRAEASKPSSRVAPSGGDSGRLICAKCCAPYQLSKSGYATFELCGYCAVNNESFSRATDHSPAKAAPFRADLTSASRRLRMHPKFDARPGDLEQAWATPSWES